MIKQKRLLSIIGLGILVVGLAAGLTLIQETQLFRQKAVGTIPYPCGVGLSCYNALYERCPITMTNTGAYICLSNDVKVCCCPTGKTLNTTDPVNPKCVAGGGGGGGGGGTGKCGINSAANCVGKKPGDECKNGKKCKDTGQKDKNGDPQCSCTGSGGGGGGGGGDGGGSCDIDYEGNPSVFTGFSKSGELILFVDPGGYEFNIALKKNVDTCSQTDYDVLLDTKNAVDSRLATGIQVAQGDQVCVYAVGYEGTPGGGWIEPEGGQCKGPKGTPKDISALLALAPEAVSVQCWGDVEIEDCDFNDFVFVFAVGESGATGDGLKLRFQGITKKANDQLINATLLQGSATVWSAQEVNVANNDGGVYTLNVDQSVLAGTYDLLVKSHSHLQKRFTNLVYNGNNQLVDLSTTEANQCRAGDVTDDNVITIDDVAAVSRYYTDFAVAVNQSDAKMVAADINKDDKITIQDLALIAINWSDFEVKGDI